MHRYQSVGYSWDPYRGKSSFYRAGLKKNPLQGGKETS